MKLIPTRAAILVSLLFVFSLVAAACVSDPTAVPTNVPTAAPTVSPTETPEKLIEVSLALDWFPWSNHSGLYIAQERGYFADEGLDVTIYVPGDPSTVLQTVAAGRDDFGISYQPELLIAREQGIEAVSIMALVQHPLNSIMALAESGIMEPKDLKGNRAKVSPARRSVGRIGVAALGPNHPESLSASLAMGICL